ncbi:MAG: hypothetical protein CL916_06940 [Deltaproteobacteria bacterium]|nr:hypothetical protein [Deltaproteobacteria bacterium]
MIVALCFVNGHTHADHISKPLLHWTQSNWLGTGFYSVDQSEVFHISTPIVFPVFVHKKIAYQFSSRVSFGLAGFRLLDFAPPTELTTLSFLPGFQIKYRLSNRWQLKSYAHAGLGGALAQHKELSYAVNTGFKSRYQFNIGKWYTKLGHEIQLAKYHETRWSPNTFVSFNHGIDVIPPFRFTPLTSVFDIGFFAIHTLFNPKAFHHIDDLSWTLKLGFHIGKVKPGSLNLRGGLYYVAGDERLRGIRFNFGVPL